eukprot:355425-Chlamydomonas_euryale.AAC.7
MPCAQQQLWRQAAGAAWQGRQRRVKRGEGFGGGETARHASLPGMTRRAAGRWAAGRVVSKGEMGGVADGDQRRRGGERAAGGAKHWRVC